MTTHPHFIARPMRPWRGAVCAAVAALGLNQPAASAGTVDVLTIVASLYGPAKDVGERLITDYFERRTRLLLEASHAKHLKSCDAAYFKFWTKAASGQMDKHMAERYGQFFEKHCYRLWQEASR